MKTWNNYKEYVTAEDPESQQMIASMEEQAAIISEIIKQRNALGLSQRDLASMCNHSPVLHCTHGISTNNSITFHPSENNEAAWITPDSNQAASSAQLEDDNQQHPELFLSEYDIGMLC